MNLRLSSPLALALLPAAAAALAAAACSATATNHFTGGAGGTGGAGSGGKGGSTDITVGSSSGSGGSCGGLHCSADLKSVLDCDDKVVMTCPDDKGCGAGGTCVPPCFAAADNHSTLGCDFYSVVPGPEITTRGSCFAVLLANTWKTPVTITAERKGQALDISGMARIPTGSGASLAYAPLTNGKLMPGELALLFLQQAAAGGFLFSTCPPGVIPGVAADTSVNGTGTGDAFHIKTDAPVVAYDIYPYGGAKTFVSSATLLIPTTAWDTNYVANDGWATDPDIGGLPFGQVVAASDNTNVTVALPGAGQPQSITLNAGQFVQFMSAAEVAGAPIVADKPVGVWGGSSCMNIPVGTYACDSAHQQIAPVKALGHAYVAVRYRDRKAGVVESVPWTLIGAVDGTTLTYDPAPPSGAPATLDRGQVARFNSESAFSVQSQDKDHPFSVNAHQTGWQAITTNSVEGQGDAETVNVIPPDQWLRDYIFLTDPTYSNTHLVLIRKKDKDGQFHDVTLDCAGSITGFQPIGDAGEYQFARVDLVVNGAPVGACNNGVHSASSTAPFALTVWGWDLAVSYAYPAGMSVEPLSTVVVPAIPK